MYQNENNPKTVSRRATMSTKTLVSCAVFAALGVVLSRLFGMMPNAYSRFSIESLPIFLSGILFGPMAGGLVGFCEDFVGCMFSGYGYNPLFCLPPILYGVFGGLFRRYLGEKPSFFRLLVALLPAVVLGSILWQSFALTYVYFKDGPFWEGFLIRLSARSVQFAITMVINAVLANLLFRTGVFNQVGLWPLEKNK